MKIVSKTFDSICAISSPPGIGGVSLIRISGKDAITIVETIFSKPLQVSFFCFAPHISW